MAPTQISTGQVGLGSEAGLPAHSGALEAVFLCSGIPGARLLPETTPSLFGVSPSMRSPSWEKKRTVGKEGGGNETVMGVSTATGMCAHCQP